MIAAVPLPRSLKESPETNTPGSTDSLGVGDPVVVTRKLTGKPAVPVSVAGEVIPRCGLTSTLNCPSTGLVEEPFEADRANS